MATRQYVGARYVPKFFDGEGGSSEWVSGIQYDALTVVTYLGNSFTSKKPVPAGIGAPNVNTEYWANTGNYNQQIEVYRQELQDGLKTVDDVENKVDTYDAKFTSYDTDIATLKTDVNGVKVEQNVTNTNLNGVADRVTSVESDVYGLKNNVNNNTQSINSVNTNVTLLTSHIDKLHKGVYVVDPKGLYTTINSAIQQAITDGVTKTDRALLIITPGVYTEEIKLRPNPGIDILGYGATVQFNSTSPRAPLELSDETTIVGLRCVNTGGTGYACHVERDENYNGNGYNGSIKFQDCLFTHSSDTQALGIGFDRGQTIEINNCKIVSTNNYGLYLHNCGVAGSEKQTLFLRENYIEGCGTSTSASPEGGETVSNVADALFDDAAHLNGRNGSSPIDFMCVNNTFRHRNCRFRYDTGMFTQINNRVSNNNISISGGAHGNNAVALNYQYSSGGTIAVDNLIAKVFTVTVPVDSNGYSIVQMPYNRSQVAFASVNSSDGTPTFDDYNNILNTNCFRFSGLVANNSCTLNIGLIAK